MPGTDSSRLIAHVHGHVRGVGFRWWTRALLADLGLTGSATNLPDGSVQVVAEGGRHALQQLADALRSEGTPGRVSDVTVTWHPSEPEP